MSPQRASGPAARAAETPPRTELPLLHCSGCGAMVRGDAVDPFRCPAAGSGDGRDHVLEPDAPPPGARFSVPGSRQPFIRHRELLWTWRLARARGLTDADWIEVVSRLDNVVAAVDGHGFLPTPCAPPPGLGGALGLDPAAVWVKDETGNVSGSHKARHLFGLALLLEVRERTGLADPGDRTTRELAIASCGNAALAAAVIARAAGRPLRVFVPPDAHRRVLERLADLGARIEVCHRRPGENGDPCVHAFRAARDRGAIPFAVQGSENGLTLDGGRTLAWELAEAFASVGAAPDRLFVQVGGGALASACVSGLRFAVARGLLPAMPRLHPVQTAGALPLRRAWERVAARAIEGDEARARVLPPGVASAPAGLGDASSAITDLDRAEVLLDPERADAVRAALRHAREHRARYMWPWEETPHSIAHGILDDETYDWAAVVEGTIASGGWPLTVSERRLAEARGIAHAAAGIRADATGAAGLAGLLELLGAGTIGPWEKLAVLFTGVER